MPQAVLKRRAERRLETRLLTVSGHFRWYAFPSDRNSATNVREEPESSDVNSLVSKPEQLLPGSEIGKFFTDSQEMLDFDCRQRQDHQKSK